MRRALEPRAPVELSPGEGEILRYASVAELPGTPSTAEAFGRAAVANRPSPAGAKLLSRGDEGGASAGAASRRDGSRHRDQALCRTRRHASAARARDPSARLAQRTAARMDRRLRLPPHLRGPNDLHRSLRFAGSIEQPAAATSGQA